METEILTGLGIFHIEWAQNTTLQEDRKETLLKLSDLFYFILEFIYEKSDIRTQVTRKLKESLGLQ